MAQFRTDKRILDSGQITVAGGLDNHEYQLGTFINGTTNNIKVLSKMDWFQPV